MPQQQQIIEAVLTFINAKTWRDSQQFVQQNALLLLTVPAEQIMDKLIEEYHDNEQAVKLIRQHQDLLRQCRKVGIEAAFAKLTQSQSGSDISPHLQTLIDQAKQAEARYLRHGGGLPALNESIAAWQQLFSHPDFAQTTPAFQAAVCNDAGIVFSYRYTAGGSPADLANALALTEQAVSLTPPDSPNLPRSLNNLGNRLSDRYARTGAEADLRQAIERAEQAVLLTQPDSPYLPGYLNNLGKFLSSRYARTGSEADLRQAIEQAEQAVLLTPPDSPYLPALLDNLGTRLSSRYARTGSEADLRQAIERAEQAVRQTPPDSPYLPTYLNNLGNWLSYRYARTGAEADLRQAIERAEQAVHLTPPDSPYLPTYLNDLGTLLSSRYARTGAEADLRQAIDVTEQAIKLTPPDSPDLPIDLNNLGTLLSSRYARTKDETDLRLGQEKYRQACKGNVKQTELVVSSRAWGNWALKRQAWAEATEAYGYGFAAIRQLYRNQSDRASKESWLKEVRNLHARAGYAWAKLHGQTLKSTDNTEGGFRAVVSAGSNNLESDNSSVLSVPSVLARAAECLEEGRAFQLAEALARDWRNLQGLQGGPHDGLYQAYRQTVERLNWLENQKELDRAALSAARQQLDELIAQIRQLEGYAQFLQLEVEFKRDILAALQDSTIYNQKSTIQNLVYTAVTPQGGLALMVQANGQLTPVWLPELKEAVLSEKVQHYLGIYGRWSSQEATRYEWFDALDEITAWLWQVLMGPLVNSLSLSRKLELEKESQTPTQTQTVVLIPQGMLGLLPLHAAWVADDTRPTKKRYALDEFNFTYAPNARSLAVARQRAELDAAALLLIDNPDGSLHFSEAESTAAMLHFPDGQRLREGAATLAEVKRLMPSHPLLHFSTHGRAGWNLPLDGGLLLADNRITLQDILGLRLEQARLAILSACETGVGGTKDLDEVISLPTGLAQAGVAGVVASLWSVSDASTMMLMVRFYDLWRVEGLSPSEALRQAQMWLRDSSLTQIAAYFEQHAHLPNEVKTTVARCLKLVDEGEYAPLFYWGAFGYTGV